GKGTPGEEEFVRGRGGSGLCNVDGSEGNGAVVGMRAVTDADKVMLITEKGILIRTRVEEIRETGRNAQGVRLIKLDEGDRLVAMAKIDSEGVVKNGEEGEAKSPPETEPRAEDEGTSGNGDANPQP